MRAKSTGGVVVLLYVIEPGDFQHWLGVEKIMREEALTAAHAALDVQAAKVRERLGIEPELVVREGKPTLQKRKQKFPVGRGNRQPRLIRNPARSSFGSSRGVFGLKAPAIRPI